MKELTPMMKQYMSIKKRYKDAILFFRLGDFYEMFYEDAIEASKELEIVLTQRDSGGIPMCGIPHHVSEVYIARLVEKGYKVAICEQLEEPSEAKGIVKRDVVRVVTPGTITDSNVLDEKTNNYLVTIYLDEEGVGISYVDSSTGDIHTTEYIGDKDSSYSLVLDELGKTYPSEIICNRTFMENKKIINLIENRINPYINIYEDITIEKKWTDMIIHHFNVDSLDCLNLKDKMYSTLSTGKLIDYLYETQKHSLEHINELKFYKPIEYMALDINTRTNLEIHETIMSREKKGSLVWILDKTSTAMGARLLKSWLDQPLINIKEIEYRQDIVSLFVKDIILMDKVKDSLKKIYDLERLISKISYGNCNARDLYSLKTSISRIPGLKLSLVESNEKLLVDIGENLDSLTDIYKLIHSSIVENPPISIREGELIKLGYNEELDKFKRASIDGKQWLTELEAKEKEKTKIRNLKIGFNNMSGYFFEVTNANVKVVPDYFIRRQTLKNSERYHTEELKEIESQILGAEEKMVDMEYTIFQDIRSKVKAETYRIQKVSKQISEIDVLSSFSQVAYRNDYIKPQINNNGIMNIKEGRHPVVEETIENNMFVPNDIYLDNDKEKIQIITGPNMSGKSTYMRQIAIITLLAQVGSFVPAKEANISVVDKIFTRIGASDNLSQGESTFMVEMNEVSNIIKNATRDSLIILDEVGRGTSTYDGLSIAWAIIEYIAENIKAKTLFATHYHELVELEETLPDVNNLTIMVEEKGDEVIFLRKIIKGSTNKSYGIKVAELAGINDKVINRANEVLNQIEEQHGETSAKLDKKLKQKNQNQDQQLNILDYRKGYFIDKINDIDTSKLTPMEAINLLYDLTEEAKKIKEGS